MANKPSPNSLIHCSQCGEDYSATYKRCPFCGARNAPEQSDPERPASSADLDDTYVFDGQELFDNEGEEDYVSTNSKGGKRLAERPLSNPFANADINWPRVITFICSLIIIVSAMIIVFTVVYPQLRKNPTADSTGSPSATTPAGDNTEGLDPSAAVTGEPSTDPGTVPSSAVTPAVPTGLRGFTTNTYGRDEEGFTLEPGGSWRMRLTFDPADWSGEVTYSVSDTRYATVSADGNVVNVNQDSSLHGVILTITAGGISLEMPVYCKPPASQPPASDPPASQPPASQPPASEPPASQPPSGGNVGKQGTVSVGSGGLNVRSGPGTDYDVIGSLWNGSTVTILEDPGNGWYKVSYTNADGAASEGYISSTFISLN